MDIERLRKEIEADEGRIEKIYEDHLGYPTFGIGHLIVQSDPEYGMPTGMSVSSERVNDAFERDVHLVLRDCRKLYTDFDSKPEEVQMIIANMMFNMGLTRLAKFRNMKIAVDNEDWKQAAFEMMDSKWANQVPNRAKRLSERMKNV